MKACNESMIYEHERGDAVATIMKSFNKAGFSRSVHTFLYLLYLLYFLTQVNQHSLASTFP